MAQVSRARVRTRRVRRIFQSTPIQVPHSGPRRGCWPDHDGVPRRALRGGISKVNFEQSLPTFGNTCPQNGSNNEPRAPRTSLGYPHIGPFVVQLGTAFATRSQSSNSRTHTAFHGGVSCEGVCCNLRARSALNLRTRRTPHSADHQGLSCIITLEVTRGKS